MEELELIELRQKDFSCEVLVNYGAALNSYKYKDVEFVNGYKEPNEIQQQKYKGVILAPFPNRTAQAKYAFKKKNFILHINREKEGLALHGLLYNKAFHIESQDEQKLNLVYDYKGEEKGFPFKFTIRVSYLLAEDGSLTITSEVENKSKATPFGLGWHPYFRIGSDIDRLELRMPAVNQLELDDALIPTGVEIPFCTTKRTLFLGEYHFDDCFRLTDPINASFMLSSDTASLEVKSCQAEDFPFFQIYTPKDRKSIAIEPMTCAPNALNNLKGLLVLEPGEKKSFGYQIQGKAII